MAFFGVMIVGCIIALLWSIRTLIRIRRLKKGGEPVEANVSPGNGRKAIIVAIVSGSLLIVTVAVIIIFIQAGPY